MFKSAHFTVSEEALTESVGGQVNYEWVFSNWDHLNVLANNYANAGFVLKNEAAVDFFLAQEKAHSANSDKAKVFVLLRAAFGISKSPIEEAAKEAPKEGAKEPVVETAKEAPKEAPKEEPKADEVKPEDEVKPVEA